MSENNHEQPFTDEEISENSRVDALAILTIVLIIVGLATYTASL